MKISRPWLQTYFDAELPSADALADALTFHAFEIESIEDGVLDVKVTPNRGHDCLSHRGIAKELSAILDIPLKVADTGISLDTHTDELVIAIDDTARNPRHVLGLVRGVKVGPSPRWLVERLEAVGQRSINNVVDATNFVMHDMGQPTHVFDAKKLVTKDGSVGIRVRDAREGESIELLGGLTKTLAPGMLVLADVHADTALDVAGIKGGTAAELDASTTDIVITAANFDGPSIRKTSRALKLRTDASSRFEQVMSPELAASGMRAVAALIQQLAGGEIVGFVDMYPAPQVVQSVSVPHDAINAALGLALSADDMRGVFVRLGFVVDHNGSTVTVTPSPERLDIQIAEDLIEEVGRIIGYDTVPATELPSASRPPEMNERFARDEAARQYLREQGFSEVFTSVFVEDGERAVSNKIGGDKPYLRSSLVPGLSAALERNVLNKDLLGLRQVKLFEIGTVWRDGKELVEVAIAVEKVKKMKTQEEYQNELDAFTNSLRTTNYELRTPPLSDVRYVPFSKYPFIARDIALWVPAGTSEQDVEAAIRTHAGSLLVRIDLFDRFEKDGRVSYAFRLIFQSMDRTLFDGDATERMESVYAAVKAEGWEVR